MTSNGTASRLWWSVPAVAVLLLYVFAIVFGNPGQTKPGRTSYSVSSDGVRAAYLLLEELHYPVVRARRPPASGVRWVLFPSTAQGQTDLLRSWVQDGGVLVLADDSPEFAGALGINLDIDKNWPVPAASYLGSTQTTMRGGQRWLEEAGVPVVTIHRLGRGEVWLINRPDITTNGLIGKGNNGVTLCRLAEATINRAAEMHPSERAELWFDEYYHGMRDRPGVTELLLAPPMRWFTLGAALWTGLLLWHAVPRWGLLRPELPARRRSKEEYLDAVARLLDRKADYADALATARDDLLRELERELGIPRGTSPEVLAQEIKQRRPGSEALLAFLTTNNVPEGRGPAAFVRALRRLESARSEWLDGPRNR